MRRVVCALVAVVAAVWFVPSALASVTPSLTLDQSAGTTAGSSVNLGVDIKFAPTGTDSPKDLAMALPSGLLANASVDGGACLTAKAPTAACQVGTGTVSASSTALGTPVALPSIPVTFDLVAPPAAGDLAGLAIVVGSVPLDLIPTGTELGSPGAVVVDSSSDRVGVGLDIDFTNIPNNVSLSGISTPIAVDEIDGTFDSLRMPTSCPSTPAEFTIGADSYGASTVQTAQAPLTVTGCSGLAFSPAFRSPPPRTAPTVAPR